MILHQRGLHMIVTLELNEAAAHGLSGVLVRTETDLKGLELSEMFLDLLFRGSEGKVAYALLLASQSLGG